MIPHRCSTALVDNKGSKAIYPGEPEWWFEETLWGQISHLLYFRRGFPSLTLPTTVLMFTYGWSSSYDPILAFQFSKDPLWARMQQGLIIVLNDMLRNWMLRV